MGHSRPLFLFVFSIQLTVNVRYKFLPMTRFEPLESEATTVPTEPQPLRAFNCFVTSSKCDSLSVLRTFDFFSFHLTFVTLISNGFPSNGLSKKSFPFNYAVIDDFSYLLRLNYILMRYFSWETITDRSKYYSDGFKVDLAQQRQHQRMMVIGNIII